MLLEKSLASLIAHWPHICVSALLFCVIRNKYYRGLNKYPGPLLAQLTGWWRFFDVLKGHAQHTHIELHERHGDIVRIGPDVLSFGDPAAIKDIYGLGTNLTDYLGQTEFYPVQNNISGGRRIPSLFSTTDESFHAQFRRCVNAAFSMSTMVSYEPLIGSTTKAYLEKTQQYFCETDAPCDFARWLQFYAFDVIGEISFSKPLGFVDANADVDGIVEDIANMLRYAGYIGQQPWLDRYVLHKNPLKMFLARHLPLLSGSGSGSSPVAAFASRRMAERRSQPSTQKSAVNPAAEAEQGQGGGVDFLTRFTLAQKEHPAFMTDARVLTACTSLVNAGSDTTAITLSAVFYHLLRHRHAYDRLMEELDDAAARGAVAFDDAGVLGWADSRKLPYLDAVINESFRVFPAAGLLLERHVPPAGASICGEWIPGGTIVGCSAWVLHRRREVFGDDVERFRPERWLEAGGERRKRMDAAMFQFGAGARTCIGRHISTMEVYKLVPSFLRKFEVEFADPGRDWKTLNCWFVRQLDFNVRFRRRDAKE